VERARRAHVVVLNCAIKARDGRSRHPDPELFGALCDFFTRAVVFPGQVRCAAPERVPERS